MNLHVCVNGHVSCVSHLWWLGLAYQGRVDEISVGNEGEDVANNFYRKIQQRKLSADPHRGKWEEVDGMKKTRGRWLTVVNVNV